MDSLELIQTFREVAQRGSFSAAARAVDMSPANVSKYIAQLEERFGVRLFNRTTRKVSLTDAGQLLLERSGALLDLINLTAGELHERATRPSGRLAITAPHGLMHTHLPTMLGQFMQAHPDVTIHLQVSNHVVDLAEEGVDLALRVGPINDANIIVRRLIPMDYVVAASPDYWRKHGLPKRPSDLSAHQQLAYALPGDVPRWSFHVDGQLQEVHPQAMFCATDPAPLPQLATMGLGVIWVPRLAILSQIDSGALEPALQKFSVRDIWIYAAYAQRRHNSAALRALLEHLETQLRGRAIGTSAPPAQPGPPAPGTLGAAATP